MPKIKNHDNHTAEEITNFNYLDFKVMYIKEDLKKTIQISLNMPLSPT
jgi:hypothetical protein